MDKSARMFSERPDEEGDSMMYSPLKCNQSNASSYHRRKKEARPQNDYEEYPDQPLTDEDQDLHHVDSRLTGSRNTSKKISQQ